MDEVEIQTKRELLVQYIFSSLMIILYAALIGMSSIVYKIESSGIALPFTIVSGFLAFIIILFIFFIRNLEDLCDAIYKLNEGDYL